MSLTYSLRVKLELRLTRQRRENRLYIHVTGFTGFPYENRIVLIFRLRQLRQVLNPVKDTNFFIVPEKLAL